MNKIKGLILKDLYELKSYKKNLLFTILIYVAIIIINSDSESFPTIGSAMIIFIFGSYAVATFTYDEKSKSDRYILTLPITKKDVVKSKYIFIFLSILVGSIVSITIEAILKYTGLVETINMKDILSSTLGITFAFSIIHGIQVPLIYKYGAEKGRLSIYLVIMGLAVLFGGLAMVIKPNINLEFLDKLDVLIPFVFIIIILFNYYISYKISTKIYMKQEV